MANDNQAAQQILVEMNNTEQSTSREFLISTPFTFVDSHFSDPTLNMYGLWTVKSEVLENNGLTISHNITVYMKAPRELNSTIDHSQRETIKRMQTDLKSLHASPGRKTISWTVY
ncbi:MAG: hypothetical protein ACK58T_10550, partial [Phycisphaerae bacterium]